MSSAHQARSASSPVLPHTEPLPRQMLPSQGRNFFPQRIAQKERSHQIKDNAYFSLTPLAFPDCRSEGRSRDKEKKNFPKRAMRDSPPLIWLSKQPVTQRGAVCAACLEAHRLRDGKSPSAGVKFFINISSFLLLCRLPVCRRDFRLSTASWPFTYAGSLGGSRIISSLCDWRSHGYFG